MATCFRLTPALLSIASGLFLFPASAQSNQSYKGPRPPKSDVVYLVHASNLVPTEVTEAKEDSKKNSTMYSVPGASSSARTPLAEPIFLIMADHISAESLELYRMEVKNGQREVSTSSRRTRGGPRPFRVSVTRLDRGLYRLEASETLENGQYALTPPGSNKVFCFEVY
ncbi:MAG TPA: hypothetical protein VN841_27805 [Bryobacteraceae bacterium]|nr:hypothetical protein [Bryobacteraceae bacterium]